jgi:SAM-dependent methyltransferase
MISADGGEDVRRPDNPARPYVPDVTPNMPEQSRKSPRGDPAGPREQHPNGDPSAWNATDEQGYFYRDPRREPANPFFAQPMRDYVLRELGRPVSVLQAGCLAPLRELGIGALEEGGFEVSVTLVDDDTPLARRVLAEVASAYDDVLTGDLRTAPVPQRAFDVVYCARLLERVQHVEVVLDRLVSALKPGGLLMIRMCDRASASALLDRWLPTPVRAALWKDLHPGIPGPFPAVYEKSATEQGIHSYVLIRGLVVAHHTVVPTAERTTQSNQTRLSSSVRTICGIISWITRGRFGVGHDELLYVIRKPQDRFAHVV